MVRLQVIRQGLRGLADGGIVENHHLIRHQAPLHDVGSFRCVRGNNQVTQVFTQHVGGRNARGDNLQADARRFLSDHGQQSG